MQCQSERQGSNPNDTRNRESRRLLKSKPFSFSSYQKLPVKSYKLTEEASNPLCFFFSPHEPQNSSLNFIPRRVVRVGGRNANYNSWKTPQIHQLNPFLKSKSVKSAIKY